ncbi:unnamed protein product [Vitrella brassicaformis CCMP3155]|uniref:Peptidase M20 dimerisation domain-containing protein n=2 Tax=Vitrella brassicaformis TaxID=1169539 RepID=A0A0G4FA05_VITBC|nr:unnamed protein product [Vitrella brassicaformis CCMP3155]|eukprot:CEM09751.1 unnamed protein product [Vitrella brassicaformis CCMP3155]
MTPSSRLLVLLSSSVLLSHRASAVPFADLISEAKDIHAWTSSKRRHLHQIPELFFREFKTSQFIQQTLDEIGVKYTTGWGKNANAGPDGPPGGTGVVADLGTGKPPCVALRADIDGLPIQEETDLDFKSTHPGRMHACGHDAHTTMLLAAAKLLKEREKDIQGTIRLIFQPAEEGGPGALMMREEGVLTQYPPVQQIFGFHVWPKLPTGTLGGRGGPLLAAGDFFDIKLQGVGGHAAMPHLAIDPVPGAAQLALALQTLVSRDTDPIESKVVSVTVLRTDSDANNVIPDWAMLKGTFRTLSSAAVLELRERIRSMSESIAQANRLNATVTYLKDFAPPTLNDNDMWTMFTEVMSEASDSLPAGLLDFPLSVTEVPPTMGGEDFSFFTEAVPALFVLLGHADGKGIYGQPSTSVSVHNPEFALDERVLDIGAALHPYLAFSALDRLSKGGTTTKDKPTKAEL